MSASSSKDRVYAQPQADISPFQFDEHVATVFDDMARRSIPNYRAVLAGIGQMAKDFITPHACVYDLGCSLGAASLAVLQAVPNQPYTLLAIDQSNAMVRRAQAQLTAYKHQATVRCLEGDVTQIEISNACYCLLNYTLQFIPTSERFTVLKKIYQGLNPGGALVLSEKITIGDTRLDSLYIEHYHAFKRHHGYSELEIAQKRQALENVLVPDSLNQHIERLRGVGFEHISVWSQWYNFVSIIAIKKHY